MSEHPPHNDTAETPADKSGLTREELALQALHAEGEAPSMQGNEFVPQDTQEVADAVEAAFDYRGDVSLELDDERVLEGYLFDRRKEDPEPHLRLMLTAGGRERVPFHRIRRIRFTGRDTAAGRSWETWIRKYHEKKARGEAANLMPEPLDEASEAQPGAEPPATDTADPNASRHVPPPQPPA